MDNPMQESEERMDEASECLYSADNLYRTIRHDILFERWSDALARIAHLERSLSTLKNAVADKVLGE